MHKSHWVLLLGVLVVVAPEMKALHGAGELMEWSTAWRMIELTAGAVLVRLSGQQWEKKKANGAKG